MEGIIPATLPLPPSRSVSSQLDTINTISESVALDEAVPETQDEIPVALELQELGGGRVSPVLAPSAVSQKQLKLLGVCRSKGKAVAFWSFVIGLLGFIVNTTLVEPTIKGAQYAEIQTNLAAWQSAKEFQDFCQDSQTSTNLSTPECQKALSMTLPAPPLFDSVASNKGVARSTSKGSHKRNLTSQLLHSNDFAKLRLLCCTHSHFCSMILTYLATALVICGLYGFFRVLHWCNKNIRLQSKSSNETKIEQPDKTKTRWRKYTLQTIVGTAKHNDYRGQRTTSKESGFEMDPFVFVIWLLSFPWLLCWYARSMRKKFSFYSPFQPPGTSPKLDNQERKGEETFSTKISLNLRQSPASSSSGLKQGNTARTCLEQSYYLFMAKYPVGKLVRIKAGKDAHLSLVVQARSYNPDIKKLLYQLRLQDDSRQERVIYNDGEWVTETRLEVL